MFGGNISSGDERHLKRGYYMLHDTTNRHQPRIYVFFVKEKEKEKGERKRNGNFERTSVTELFSITNALFFLPFVRRLIFPLFLGYLKIFSEKICFLQLFCF